MNETIEALEAAGRDGLLEIAEDVFGKDYSKSKKKDETIRAELLKLAKQLPEGEGPAVPSVDDESNNESSDDEDQGSFEPDPGEPEETQDEAPKKLPRRLRHKKTGRIVTWTKPLSKLDDLEEVK